MLIFGQNKFKQVVNLKIYVYGQRVYSALFYFSGNPAFLLPAGLGFN